MAQARKAKGKGVKWDIKPFRKKLAREMGRRVEAILVHVESVAVTSISRDQPVRRSETGKKGLIGLDPAKAGEPPKVLEGRLRQSVTHVLMAPDKRGAKGRVGTNVVYGRRHEYGTHPWLRPALTSSKEFIMKTLGRGMKKRKG